MRLSQTGDRVEGSYDHKNGRLEGKLASDKGGNRLAGPLRGLRDVDVE